MENFDQKTILHYRLRKQIGKGGMGIVYKADDLSLERVIAIKVLSPDAVGDAVSRERFLQEAKAAAKLSHPNITTIYSIEEVDNMIFIVMEYVEGQTLFDIMKDRRLGLDEILDIALQLAEGLQEAHQKNIIHRDVKPDNIMIAKSGILKIMDFGLAKIRGHSRLTQDDFSMGTIDYMSPEQISRESEVEQRSDIFSFGILLYEMLAGEPPFKGSHDWAVLYAILNNPPEPLPDSHFKIPLLLRKLDEKCLQKEPNQRYQTVAEIIQDLKQIQKMAEIKPEKAPVKSLNKKLSFGLAALLLTISAVIFYFFKPSFLLSPHELNYKAVQLILAGNSAAAQKHLFLALKKDSTFSTAWSNLGLAYLYQTKFDSALKCARTAIRIDPGNIGAYFILARTHEQIEDFEAAIQIYLRAIQQDSSVIQAYNEAAYLFIHLGQAEEAIKLLNLGLKKSSNSLDDAYTYKNLGKAYLVKNQSEEAIRYLQKSLAIDSTFVETQTLLRRAMLNNVSSHTERLEDYSAK